MIDTSKQPKKLCLLITQAESGGAQKYVYDLANQLDSATLTITIAHGEKKDTWLSNQAKRLSIPVQHLHNLKRSIRPVRDILAIIEMIRFFKKNKFDVVHCNSSKAGILGPLAARIAGVPKVVFTCHGWAFDDPRPTWEKTAYKLAHKLAANYTTTIICVSDYSRRAGFAIGIPESKCVTIHNGYDFSTLPLLTSAQASEDLRTRFSLPKKPIIGTIANYYPTKGLSFLISAIAKIHTQIPDYIFCLIGNGEQQQLLVSLREKHKLQNKVFLLNGVLQAGSYIPAFDVFVLSSVKEAFPYVVLEAMATGTPIAATNVGGVPEALANYPSNYYRLVPSQDPPALGNAMVELCTIPKIDSTILESIRKKLSIATMITKTLQVYEV